jgi:hypothetical protein
MITFCKKFSAVSVRLNWELLADCNGMMTSKGAPRIDAAFNGVQRNLFDPIDERIWGSYGKGFFDVCQASLANPEKLFEDGTDSFGFFRVQNGIIEIMHVYDNFDGTPSSTEFGITYIDFNNFRYYSEQYEICRTEQRPVTFHVFCYHINRADGTVE